MRVRRKVTPVTFAIAILIAAFLVVSLPSGPATAVQPDDEVAAADAKLKAAQLKLGKTFARFNKAEKQHKDAVRAVRTAAAKERRARAEASAAEQAEQNTRGRFDEFVDANYRGGKSITWLESVLVSDGPDDMLQRAQILDALSGEYAQVVDTMAAATARKAKAERDAKQALTDAARNRDRAAKAKVAAKRAYKTAVAAQAAAEDEVNRLAAAASTIRGGGSGEVVLPAAGTFTSGFGPRGGTIHEGVDLANSIGTPVLSAMAGEVIDAGPASGFGQWVRVQHDPGLVTVYGHVATFTVGVGDTVAAGDQIATMGNEGQSTGPHLHFEVHQDGTPIDPQPWLASFGIQI